MSILRVVRVHFVGHPITNDTVSDVQLMIYVTYRGDKYAEEDFSIAFLGGVTGVHFVGA